MSPRRRGGRVAEGGGLLNRCRGSTRTVSSILIPSASSLGFLRLSWQISISPLNYPLLVHRIVANGDGR